MVGSAEWSWQLVSAVGKAEVQIGENVEGVLVRVGRGVGIAAALDLGVLPPGARVAYPADTYAFIHQQLWVLEGVLGFLEGDVQHDLSEGDCLMLGAPADCVFSNPGRRACRYLVALTRRV